MDSMWNEDGMINSTWIPLGSIWNAGIFTMDSMEQIQFHGNSTGMPEKQCYLINKNSSNIKNQAPDFVMYHVIYQLGTLSAALCNCSRI